MARMPAGAMLAIAAPADEIIPLLPHELTLAVDNGPRQCVVAGTVARLPKLPILSAATGRVMTAEQATDPMFWANQLVQPVRFGAALAELLTGAPRVVLEVGPARTLTSIVFGPRLGRFHLVSPLAS
jgi:phthiocerol/phenolphthiocerol synthesis type-I polyketide synthase E